jgi:prepilin-type N-terminal cleavage/methylation domain-containing protein/prepilin-type processing-associated H-X9-DG protein
MKNRAFTLIELLVVISIIVILAALAVPALTGAIDKGKYTNEASNMRNLGVGTIAYANDNADEYFLPDGTGDTAWPNLLKNRYVPDMKVFLSPFDKRKTGTAPFPVSFGVNSMILSPSGTNNSSKFTYPSELILMAPATTDHDKKLFVANLSTSNATISKDSNGTTGKKRINILYADAHVGSLSFSGYKDGTTPEGKRHWDPLAP